MAVKKLDFNRYKALVYGDEVENPNRPAKFYQDGLFFDGNGIAIDASVTEPEIVAVAEPPVVVEQPDNKDRTEAMTALKKMSAHALKKVARTVHEDTGAELPAMSGAGVMARLVKYIADNTD